jgi:hypothetical protein
VLRKHGVRVISLGDDYYELVDADDDPVVLHLAEVTPPEIVVYLYRRFGEIHGINISDFNKDRRKKPRKPS